MYADEACRSWANIVTRTSAVICMLQHPVCHTRCTMALKPFLDIGYCICGCVAHACNLEFSGSFESTSLSVTYILNIRWRDHLKCTEQQLSWAGDRLCCIVLQ